MSGRFHSFMLWGVVLVAASPCWLRAQEAVQVQPEVENSRFQFLGAVNTDNVYVRSGPGDAYYATTRLPAGTQVTVVGIKYDWLKIVPPPGSFCYVSKLFVERRGDGSIGAVTKADINVRAGSDQNALKTTVLGRLGAGDEVRILGEEDEYYKIAPPQGMYVYIDKQYVNPVRSLGAAPVAPAEAENTAPPVNDDATTTQPSDAVATSTPGPATQPAVAAAPAGPSPAELAETQFQAAEADFNAASAKPLEDQPCGDLAKRYDALSKNTDLTVQDRETAGFRLAILKVRVDAQTRLAEVEAMETDAARKAQALKAEQDELQKRLETHDVAMYAAVGQLQPSSLQYGADTLYRLADPATGHTVIYLRGDDSAALKLMGQFVGVRGDTVTDGRLDVQVIPFTSIEAVDPNQVNGKVISIIIPPSMMGRAVQASAGN
ncbi:MAG TPA: SH3 domain-containing protein [Tepidisphaeraceae bacterium]|nr:SH3 domain-containing protein [Tepidisphaeraceae bacterium]